jgi:hypothetical protein
MLVFSTPQTDKLLLPSAKYLYSYRVRCCLSQFAAVFPQLAAVFPQLAAVFPQFAAVFPQFADVFTQFAAVFPQFAAVFPQFAAVFPSVRCCLSFSSLLSFLEEGRISHLLRQLASQNLPLIIPSMG